MADNELKAHKIEGMPASVFPDGWKPDDAPAEEESTYWGRLANEITRSAPQIGALFNTDEYQRMDREIQEKRAFNSRMREYRLQNAARRDRVEEQQTKEFFANEAYRQNAAKRADKAGELQLQASEAQLRRTQTMEDDRMWSQKVGNYKDAFFRQNVGNFADDASKKALAELPEVRELAMYQTFMELAGQALEEYSQNGGGRTVDLLDRQASALRADLYIDKKLGPMLSYQGNTIPLTGKNMATLYEAAQKRAEEAVRNIQRRDSGVGSTSGEYYFRRSIEQVYGSLSPDNMREAARLSNEMKTTHPEEYAKLMVLSGAQAMKDHAGDPMITEGVLMDLKDLLQQHGIRVNSNEDGTFTISNPGRNWGLKPSYNDASEFLADLKQNSVDAFAIVQDDAKRVLDARMMKNRMELAKLANLKGRTNSSTAGGPNGQPGGLSKEEKEGLKAVFPGVSRLSVKMQNALGTDLKNANELASRWSLFEVKDNQLKYTKNFMKDVFKRPEYALSQVNNAISEIKPYVTKMEKRLEDSDENTSELNYPPYQLLETTRRDLETLKKREYPDWVEKELADNTASNRDLIKQKMFLLYQYHNNQEIVDFLDGLPSDIDDWYEYCGLGGKTDAAGAPRIAVLPPKYMGLLVQCLRERKKIVDKEKERSRIPNVVY